MVWAAALVKLQSSGRATASKSWWHRGCWDNRIPHSPAIVRSDTTKLAASRLVQFNLSMTPNQQQQQPHHKHLLQQQQPQQKQLQHSNSSWTSQAGTYRGTDTSICTSATKSPLEHVTGNETGTLSPISCRTKLSPQNAAVNGNRGMQPLQQLSLPLHQTVVCGDSPDAQEGAFRLHHFPAPFSSVGDVVALPGSLPGGSPYRDNFKHGSGTVHNSMKSVAD